MEILVNNAAEDTASENRTVLIEHVGLRGELLIDTLVRPSRILMRDIFG
jgi:hypothetical protein